MKCAVTYSLSDDNNSDCYYHDIAVFTDEFLIEGYKLASSVIDTYYNYILDSNTETASSTDEYLFEFLMLGTLWQVYSGDAFGLEDNPRQLLKGLSELRQRGGYLKPGADFLRGIFATLFLSPDLDDNLFVLEPDIAHFDKLINWLEATGEFNQEVSRLKLWQQFLNNQPHDISSDYLATSITLAAWFEIISSERLGKYTPNVEYFLNHVRPSHYWREDIIFSGRRRVEYHLNMIGAEIMNRTNRQEFLKTRFKAVLLPSCMCIKPEGQCPAQKCSKGLGCVLCTPSCKVSQLTKLGQDNGFGVFIITHESSAFSEDSNNDMANETVGIVGIACILNLISGGWKAKKLGLPAQCVLLDYCGCKKHWHNKGLVTDINMNQFIKIMGIEN